MGPTAQHCRASREVQAGVHWLIMVGAVDCGSGSSLYCCKSPVAATMYHKATGGEAGSNTGFARIAMATQQAQ